MSKILELNNLIKKDSSFKKKIIDNTYNLLEENKDLNAFISLIKNYNNHINNNTLLNGIPYAIKDNINMHGTLTTGGSLFFKNYKSPYDATVVSLLNNAGAVPVAKSNLDEFGLGGTGTFSGYGHVYNPYDKERITSGSSSGSAVLVAKDIVPFALGTDTGDSIRKPASYLGIIGYKPSYGLISRYGVFPYAPSMDHVGLLTKSVTDVAIILDYISKHDTLDNTSQIQNEHNFFNNIDNLSNEYNVIYFENVLEFCPKETKELFLKTIDLIRNNNKNINIVPINFSTQLLEAIPSIYKIISYSEAVSCYQNITGIPFGEKEKGNSFEEIISKTRSKYFGDELKRRFIFGSYCTLSENYKDIFIKSKKMRSILVQNVEKILNKSDFIIMPGSSTYAPTIIELNSKKYNDTIVDHYLQLANFSGFPSITIPMGKINNNYIGINLMGKINTDRELLSFSKHINKLLNNGD